MKKLTIINLLVHMLHAFWIAIFWVQLNPSVGLHLNPLLVTAWSAAFMAEIVRWHILGKDVHEISGTYAYARTMDIANQSFLNFSWYLLRLAPKFGLLEKTAEGLYKEPRPMKLREAFSKFWLNQELKFFVLFAVLPLLGWALVDGRPVTIGGFLRPGFVSTVVWYLSMAIVGKIIAIYLYSTYISLTEKGETNGR